MVFLGDSPRKPGRTGHAELRALRGLSSEHISPAFSAT